MAHSLSSSATPPLGLPRDHPARPPLSPHASPARSPPPSLLCSGTAGLTRRRAPPLYLAVDQESRVPTFCGAERTAASDPLGLVTATPPPPAGFSDAGQRSYPPSPPLFYPRPTPPPLPPHPRDSPPPPPPRLEGYLDQQRGCAHRHRPPPPLPLFTAAALAALPWPPPRPRRHRGYRSGGEGSKHLPLYRSGGATGSDRRHCARWLRRCWPPTRRRRHRRCPRTAGRVV